jgi:2-oxoglutarate ferredoxin oxidoreductase subunit gamma
VNKRWEVRLIGTGGQGIVTVSIILANASVKEGNNVVQSQNYGPEVRGGYSTAYVIASNKSILYPKIDSPNVMMVMSDTSYKKYLPELAEDGMLIMNGHTEETLPDKVYFVPITDIAHDKVKRPITANIVSLGVIVGITGMVSEKTALEAMEAAVPSRALEINKKAFALGLEAGKAALENK